MGSVVGAGERGIYFLNQGQCYRARRKSCNLMRFGR